MSSENVIFKLRADQLPKEVTLSSMEWAVITQIDGKRTVDDIARNLAMNVDEAVKIFEALAEKGLIVQSHVKEKRVERLSDSALKRIEKILTTYIGPVAIYVLKDAINELQTADGHLLKDQLPELIELLSDEISDEKKNIQFQKEMLNFLKEL